MKRITNTYDILVLGEGEHIRRNVRMQTAFAGINSAVVGLLLAALFTPVRTSAIYKPQDFALSLVAFVALLFWKCHLGSL